VAGEDELLVELDRNDSATLFDRVGTLVHTGPTHTNVNDFRALLIEPS